MISQIPILLGPYAVGKARTNDVLSCTVGKRAPKYSLQLASLRERDLNTVTVANFKLRGRSYYLAFVRLVGLEGSSTPGGK